MPVTDAAINFLVTRGQIPSANDQRLLSVYIVPPAVTVVCYILGLALGLVTLNGQWAAMVFILAVAAICGKQATYALKEKAASG